MVIRIIPILILVNFGCGGHPFSARVLVPVIRLQFSHREEFERKARPYFAERLFRRGCSRVCLPRALEIVARLSGKNANQRDRGRRMGPSATCRRMARKTRWQAKQDSRQDLLDDRPHARNHLFFIGLVYADVFRRTA